MRVASQTGPHLTHCLSGFAGSRELGVVDANLRGEPAVHWNVTGSTAMRPRTDGDAAAPSLAGRAPSATHSLAIIMITRIAAMLRPCIIISWRSDAGHSSSSASGAAHYTVLLAAAHLKQHGRHTSDRPTNERRPPRTFSNVGGLVTVASPAQYCVSGSSHASILMWLNL